MLLIFYQKKRCQISKNFRNLFRELNITRNLGEEIENWNYEKLDETNRVAKIIKEKIKIIMSFLNSIKNNSKNIISLLIIGSIVMLCQKSN